MLHPKRDMMSSITRRGFLTTTALATANGTLRAQGGQHYHFPRSRRQATLTGAVLLPDTVSPDILRMFATSALDTARRAGAHYADVRVAEQHSLWVGLLQKPFGNLSTEHYFQFGIRVQVRGAWAFIHGHVPSMDALATAAQNAVATAKGYAGPYGGQQNLAPTPGVTGEWTTPIQLDPFTVPLYDQADLLWAFTTAPRARTAAALSGGFRWTRETRVFASTEGSLLTQTLYRSEPSVSVAAALPPNTDARVSQPMLRPQMGGYECVTNVDLQDDIKAVAEELAALAALPLRRLDVGRYPIVMDGTSLGTTLVQTFGLALRLPRVLGDEIGAAGGSFLGPPEQRLGTLITSPLLTVTADRAVPHIMGTRWDDEGIESKSFTLIARGQLAGYCASRQSVAALAALTPSVPANAVGMGCAQAYSADWPVEVTVPHLTMAPSATAGSLIDLCREVSHGLLLRQNEHRWQSDPQLTTGFKSCDRNGNLFEIVNGKVINRLYAVGLQFMTPRFWKALEVLGDASTIQPATVSIWNRHMDTWQSASAPAGVFKEIDVIATRPHR